MKRRRRRRQRPSSPDGPFAALRAKLKAYDEATTGSNWAAMVAFHTDFLAACIRDDGEIDAIAFVDRITGGSPRPPPQLRIRAWVPESIARYFRERYEAAIAAGPNARLRALVCEGVISTVSSEIDYEDLDVVAWLVGHECMRAFYEELFRRKDGGGGGYVYPATIIDDIVEVGGDNGGDDGDADDSRRQATAVIRLLNAAVQAAKAKITPPLTKAELKQRYEIAIAMEHLLAGYDVKDPCFSALDWEVLNSAAAVYRKRAEGYKREIKFAPRYKSRHSRDRVLVVRVGNAMQRLFGVRGMYGTVANLATAALGHEIKVASVRIWLKGRRRTPL
jgi:hypothetical protein